MMALSTSFSNLFPFLSPPSKSPQPPQLPLLHHHNNHRNKFIPLVLSRSETSSSVTSSSSQQREQDNLDLSFDSLSGTDSMFYASPYNVQVVIEDDEVEERVVGRFRRDVLRAGVIQEFKRRRYFEDKQEEKKRRIQDAAKRNRRARYPRYVCALWMGTLREDRSTTTTGRMIQNLRRTRRMMMIPGIYLKRMCNNFDIRINSPYLYDSSHFTVRGFVCM
ncbi:unnamed protein product [Trifolium pratense]|uniref:Uncharacterized protein n=1 Tax=Trifolium pratense TaxID=57577 RepID=A0ACB0LJ74_TRIPR|nr:unnamed protein product [Trifolium pratense]